jgi:hypothetical protein
VFPEPALPEPLAPAAPELFQSLLETQAAAVPNMFGAADRQLANGSPGGWGAGRASPRTGWDGAWSDAPAGGRLVPASHSTNPFGTSPSNQPLGALYNTPGSRPLGLFAASTEPPPQPSHPVLYPAPRQCSNLTHSRYQHCQHTRGKSVKDVTDRVRLPAVLTL